MTGIVRRCLVTGALFAFGHAVTSVVAEPVVPPEDFEVRAETGTFESVDDLIDNPTTVESNLSSWRAGDNYIIRSETDLHSIIPAPVDQVLAVLLDYAGMEDTFPSVRESTLLVLDPDPFERHVVQIELGIKVLGFGSVFDYILNNWVVENEIGGYVQTFDMEQSIDDKLYQMIGNWYVEPVNIDGLPHTYIRQYTIVGIQDGSRAMEVAMRTFGTMSLRRAFRRVSSAAKNE